MAHGSRSQEAISPISASKTSLMSSQSSSRSMTSLTPSMSPSSIISLQRTARHEKKHVIIGLHQQTPSNAPSSASSQKGQNRSAVLYTKAQKRQQQKDGKNIEKTAAVQGATSATPTATTAPVTSTPSEKPTRGAISRVSAKNRFSKWASSLHQVLSSSAHHAASSQPPPPPPPPTLPLSSHKAAAAPSLPSSSPLRAAAVGRDDDMEHISQARAPKLTEKGPVHTNTDAIGSQAKLLDPNSLASSSSSFKQPRVRIMSQSRSRKIGSGLITVFCIIAVVILVLC
ncbi:unnamed protein product [Mortierella alpina]